MTTPLNILIVEDSQDDADLLVAELRRAGFDPQWKRVETEPDFLAEIKNSPDIILSDYSMPQFNGLRAAELLQKNGSDIPFILISGTVGEDTAVEAMKRGAADYLLKDRLARLGNSVQHALEQKRLREENRRMQEQLVLHATAVATAANAVIITDRNGTILWVNPAFTTATGYTLDEAVGKTPRLLNSGKHDQAFYGKFWETILSGETWRGEIINRRKDGSLHYDEHTVTPVRSADGKITHFIGILHDITERKRTEEVLRESERRFREMLENVALVAMTLNKEGTVTFCNDHLLKLTGRKREEVIGADWFGNFIPEANPEVKKVFLETVMAGEIPPHFENPIKTRSGELREIVWSNTMLRDAAGNIVGTASIGEDVTERKQAEQELRESEEKFRQLAENINEVFWITDPAKNQMLYVSPAYERIWGRTCESLYSAPRTWLEAIYPEDRKRVLEAAMSKQQQGAYDEIYRIKRPDGSMRWVHDRAFPIRNATGEVFRVVGTAEDITRRKELEAQFHQAQKMEAVGQLAGGVAHDFNNLLTVILCNTEMLLSEEKLEPDYVDALKDIVKASKAAAQLTRQLLAFSRKQTMQTQVFSLNEVVSNLLKMLRRVIGADIELEWKPASSIPQMEGDQGMLEQVLLNLAVNARDAMPKGGELSIQTEAVTITDDMAKSHPDARAGNFICLTVRDTGCGIAPEILPRIFEPFFTTKEADKGTGHGLATVFGIVKQHRGWVEVESKVDCGTSFKVYLCGSTRSTASADSQALLPLIRGGTESILVVEDEPILRSLARRILQRLGYTIFEAASGVEALAVWKEQAGKIDLLLTDMVMPDGLTGGELADHLRAQKPQLKVIFSSGYNVDLSKKNLVSRNDGFSLPKPYEPQRLAQIVRDCLDSTSFKSRNAT